MWAKFRGDRPRDRGDFALKRKAAAKHKGSPGPGGPNEKMSIENWLFAATAWHTQVI